MYTFCTRLSNAPETMRRRQLPETIAPETIVPETMRRSSGAGIRQ